MEFLSDRDRRAQQAYDRWRFETELQSEIKRKQKAIRLKRSIELNNKEIAKRRQQCMEEYDNWKKRKELCIRLKANEQVPVSLERHHMTSPTLPGYISVWLCDEEMAHKMINKIKRPMSCSLVKTANTISLQKFS